MVKLKAVGDITLVTKSKTSPFEQVLEAFSDKDILFGNLETVLSNRGKRAQKSILLHNDPEKAKLLKDAGFDVLNLANNHIMDLGIDGLNETLDVLDRNKLSFTGVRNPKYTQGRALIQGTNMALGFLGYYAYGFEDIQRRYAINKINDFDIVKDIIDLKAHCNVVIVSLHWGVESVFYPSPKQIELARKLIDAGASIILGHGARVPQGIERYKHGLIAYSLGNFQFDFDHEIVLTNKLSEAFILSVNINQNGVESYDILPVRIDWEYVPHMMEGEEREEFLSFISKISKTITEGRVTKGWWFEQIASTFLLTNMYSWRIRVKRYGLRHALQCIKWLTSPFVIRCYIGLVSKALRKRS